MEEITATEAARWLGKSEKTIRKWIHQGKLPARIVTVDGLRQYAILTQHVEVLMDAEETQPIDDTNERIEALERRVSELEEELAQLRALERHAPLARSERRATANAQPAQELSPGLVPALEFARAHGIDKKPLYNAINREKNSLQVTSGKYPGGVTKVLDQAQQQLFYELFREHTSFIPCEACPHKMRIDQDDRLGTETY